ncbi:hypothetical protein Tco_1396148, partial [Tanacetum coccineum]
KVGWDELCAVSMFILGLQSEIGKKLDLRESCNKILDANSVGKKKDSNSKISVVNKAGKREQKREIGNDIEDKEVIEINDASRVIDISIGLMGIRLMDCGFNRNGKLCGNSMKVDKLKNVIEPVVMKTGNTSDFGLESCIVKCVKECLIEIEPVTLGVGGLELRDDCIVECLGGMEREICEKMRNSVKKNGSGVCEIEFIAGDNRS